mgnify:CR=1 FL=1
MCYLTKKLTGPQSKLSWCNWTSLTDWKITTKIISVIIFLKNLELIQKKPSLILLLLERKTLHQKVFVFGVEQLITMQKLPNKLNLKNKNLLNCKKYLMKKIKICFWSKNNCKRLKIRLQNYKKNVSKHFNLKINFKMIWNWQQED